MHFSRARLRGHREGQGLSIAAVAERVGLTEDQLWDIELGGSTELSELLVADLARALSVPNHELHSISATWTEDYCGAVLRHARPMEPADVRQAAEALYGRHAS